MIDHLKASPLYEEVGTLPAQGIVRRLAVMARWDVFYDMTFKVGKTCADEMLEQGTAKFRKNGALDMRTKSSQLIAQYYPELAKPADERYLDTA